MGLPWILEKPAEVLPSPVLEYIYVFLNALQGFFVFIVLVVTASRAKQMLATKFQDMRTSGASTNGTAGTRTTSV